MQIFRAPRRLLVLVCGLWLLLAGVPGWGQDTDGDKKRGQDDKGKSKPLPDDKRLLSLHREFVKKAENLALEYEHEKDWGKARAVYEEILKLVPQYPPANSKLEEMVQREMGAKQVSFELSASEGWHDCGITLIDGKPIIVRAEGNWVFHFEMETTADGIAIPKELRDFPLGCLVGMIPSEDPKQAKPFIIGASKQFTASRAGRLMIRMYGQDSRSNSGVLKIEIRGTFTEDKTTKKKP